MKTKFTLLLSGLMLLSLVASHASATELSACVHKKTGALRITGLCKKNELSMTLNSIGPIGVQGAQGVKGDQGPPGPRGLSGAIDVYDDKNQYLGYMIDTDFRVYLTKSADVGNLNQKRNDNYGVTVYSPELDGMIKITPLTSKQDQGDVYDEVPWFQTTNCTSTAFYDAATYLLFSSVIKRGDTYYRVTQTGQPITIKVKSFGGDNGNCKPLDGGERDVEVVSVKEEQVTLPFKTPIAFPLHFQER
jgi:hypothetical protein